MDKTGKIIIIAGLGIALIILTSKMFGRSSEEFIIKKYGKYFNSSYWKGELKRLYKKEFSYWTKKGATEQEIFAYIVNRYFDRDKMKAIASVIYDAKGTFSDDEEEALLALSKVKDLMELSYLSTVYSTQFNTVNGRDIQAIDLALNPLGYFWKAYENGKIIDPEVNKNLLAYMLTYFNKKHRKVLVKILKKMDKRGEKKFIKPPTG